jgi:hypothetical protein
MPGPIDRFNQTVCLEVPEGVTHDGVVSALDRLRAYHSVLRLRTEGRGIGTRLVIDPVEALPALELPVLDMGQFDKHEAGLRQRQHRHALHPPAPQGIPSG